MKKYIYAVVAIGIAVCARSDEIQFSNLPKAAQKTINKNLNGGAVQEIEREARNGRTVYEVEVRREGQNKHLRVDSDGRLLESRSGLELKVDGEDALDKNDGKILGVVDNPNHHAKAQAEARIGDSEVKIETKIDNNAEIQAKKENRVFNKTDGKLMGFIPWKSNQAKVQVDTDRNNVTRKADGSVDTDKQDGRILGVPKRGFETLSLRDIPSPVRQTIERTAPGAKIAEIELATHNGERVYEVDVERDGLNRELHIAVDGTLLKDSDRQGVGAPGSAVRGTGRGATEKR